jgi:hypothetical protein
VTAAWYASRLVIASWEGVDVVDQNRSRSFPLFAITRTEFLDRDGIESVFKNNFIVLVTVTLERGGRALALFDSLNKAGEASRALKLSGITVVTIESLEKLKALLKPFREAPEGERVEKICWNIRENGQSDGTSWITDVIERLSGGKIE